MYISSFYVHLLLLPLITVMKVGSASFRLQVLVDTPRTDVALPFALILYQLAGLNV